MKNQLQRSSIVLIVLDFTGLNNEAAAKIKRQVEPIIKLLGKENLYILVNKLDERRKRSMTREEVRRFVTHDLQLSKFISSNLFGLSYLFNSR